MAVLLLTVVSTAAFPVKAQPKEKKPSVLFVGKPAGNQRYEADRTGAFEKLLRGYFDDVKVVSSNEYTPDMSDSYDVTIFDDAPGALGEVEGDALYPPYLPKDFDRAAIMIGRIAPQMAEGLHLKFNFLCECLDAHAVDVKTAHPIFNYPYPVEIVYENRETPSNFRLFATGSDLGDKTPMWRVQTAGFETDKGFPAGMVSSHAAFDSPDAEVISGGRSHKDYGAVAIARHANYFMWGFSASPDYMTDEAKKAFINAVYYIRKFNGRPPVFFAGDFSRTRNGIRNAVYNTTVKRYLVEVEDVEKTSAKMKESLKKLEDRIAAGEALTQMNKDLMEIYREGIQPAPNREEFLKQCFGKLDPALGLGLDTLAIRAYYEENLPYYFDKDGKLVVDEQAKSLGIANNDPAILDACIRILEKGGDKQLASDVLHRYTNEDFSKAKEWRKWFEQNKGRFYFSEYHGYKFIVDTYSRPEDQAHANPERRVADQLFPKEPTFRDPVSFAGDVVKDAQGNLTAVVLKIRILEGWHIYAHVSDSDPFIPTELSLMLPAGVELSGNWITPKQHIIPGGDIETTVYDGTVTFIQKLEGSPAKEGGSIAAKVYYQCCDVNQCKMPTEKDIIINL